MAPQTNIGSSTPIEGNGQNIGSDLRRKEINDAAASLRGLATAHGRNATWADSAVRVASNLTAAEALQKNVIDLISPSLPALLNTIDGQVTVAARVHDGHGGRAGRQRQPGLPDALPLDADRPEHRLAALPRRPRRPRLRALPSRRRHPGRVRRDLHGLRALRLLGAAALVGRPAARPARSGAARDRPARDEPRRAHALRASSRWASGSPRSSTTRPRRTTRTPCSSRP